MKFSNHTVLPTEIGNFRMQAIKDEKGFEHMLIYHGEIENQEDLIVRVHSECITSEVFGSLRCDCKDQLWASLEKIAAAKQGLLIYLRQEGRGIGLFNKIDAYALQDKGKDTIEANIELGLGVDLRSYEVAAYVLKHLKVKSIQLLTNNPEKVEDLRRQGILVTKTRPIEIPPNSYNYNYLKVKKEQMNHQLMLLDAIT